MQQDPMKVHKEKYNKLLERHKKAETFFDGSALDAEKEKFYPEFLKLLQEINEWVVRLIRRGVKMGDWITKGFK